MVRAYLRDVLLAPCTHGYKLGHVVSLTVELIILSIDSHSLQSSITHTAQEVVLMVQLLSSLHGAVSYLLIAGNADHGRGHSGEKWVKNIEYMKAFKQ